MEESGYNVRKETTSNKNSYRNLWPLDSFFKYSTDRRTVQICNNTYKKDKLQ